MKKGLRLGAQGFLNAEPLVWPLQNSIIEHPHSILRATPSEVARRLADGELDCALAPIATVLYQPDLVPIPDVAVACRGPVGSVLLFHNDPVGKLLKIWLDPASLTSNCLAQIVRNHESKTPCEYLVQSEEDPSGNPPEIDQLPPNTGRLVIGDPALRLTIDFEGRAKYSDLGMLWKEQTGHPFVFARWLARNGDVAAELKPLLTEARDWSLRHLHELIAPLAEMYAFPPELVDRYLRANITYMHGPREQAGEKEFLLQAQKLLGQSRETVG